MATYLQGSQDYIPQIQPFQPDLNLYANILQTKQTQYDTNWKAMNKVYGQYFYADLTRDGNIERKEELLKNIDFNLKKVSQLDLSLQQNVQQATKIFKPFYEDKYLMKDMAWTKNYNGQKNRAMGLKNSKDEETRNQYWDTGVKEMDYRRDEFKELSDDDSLGFGNASYTPYVNTIKQAQKIAKEAGLSVETVDFSDDGRWIVKNKNGDALMEPLSKLFEASLGSDPGVQAVYRTQAYVNRKDYAYSNAAQFNGDKNAAEMKYLENNFNILKDQQVRRYEALREQSSVYDAKIKDAQSQMKKGNKSPQLKSYLDRLEEAKTINDSVLQRVEKDNDTLNEQQSTATTTNGFKNPYGDVESLRWKVDSGMASTLMEKDLNEAAQIFAFKDAKQDIEANPYAVNEQKHAFSMQEAALRNQGLERAARIKVAGDRANNDRKWKLDTGAYYLDETTGEVVPYEGYNNTFIDTDYKGNATDQVNLKQLSVAIAQRQTNQYAVPYMQQSLALLSKMQKQGLISSKEVSDILTYKGKKNVTIDGFNNEFQSDPYKFLRAKVGSQDLSRISKRLNTWIAQNKEVSAVAKGIPGYSKASAEFGDYTRYLESDQKWRKETSKIVEQQLEASLGDKGKLAKYLYDEKGNLRSEESFYNIVGGNKDEKAENLKISKKMSQIPDLFSIIGYGMGPKGWEYSVKRQARQAVESANKANKSGVYQELVRAAGKVYTSNKIKKAPVGISTMGEMSGAGLFTPGVQSVYVSPKGHGTKGNAYFHEFARDFRKIDFSSNMNNKISFNGPTAAGMLDENNKNTSGKALVDAIIMEMNNSKSKFTNFKMSAQSIAGNRADKGAMILRPDPEWLKSYVSTAGEGKPQNNMLNQEEYMNILTNGITVVSDSKNFTNGLFNSSYMDPIQSVVEYEGNYKWNDPYGNLEWEVSKNEFGTGDYEMKYNYKVLDQNTGEYEEFIRVNNMLTTGSNLATRRQEAINFSEDINTYNNGGY
jgi:hypothetical protein